MKACNEIKLSEAVIWIVRGEQLWREGNSKKALFSYCEALRINPRSTWAWTKKRFCLLVMGKHKDAQECLEKVCKLIDEKHPSDEVVNRAEVKGVRDYLFKSFIENHPNKERN